MSSDDKTPDEAVNAQDLIAMRKIVEKVVLRNSLTDGMPKEVAAMSVMLSLLPEIERLARDAAAVGARTALEEARESLNVHAGIEGDDGVREGVRRWPLGNSHSYSVAITEALELLDDLRIEKYTTDEEKPDEG